MPIVLVTGCGGGFGRLTALAFAARGDRVYATVRRPEDAARLENDACSQGLKLTPLTLDVRDRGQIEALVGEILDREPGIDVLVNNAGIAVPGAFEDTDPAVLDRIMRVNFFGPVWLTRALLPAMRARGNGRIIMLSSLSALVGVPGEAFYAASKAALEAAAEALRHEVDVFGIRVSVVEPGLFETGMPAKIAAAGSGPPGSPYRPLLEHLTQRAGAAAGSGDDPQIVADAIVAIAHSDNPAFRYPVGAQAERVVSTLRGQSDDQREELIKAVNQTAWWSAGETSPCAE